MSHAVWARRNVPSEKAATARGGRASAQDAAAALAAAADATRLSRERIRMPFPLMAGIAVALGAVIAVGTVPSAREGLSAAILAGIVAAEAAILAIYLRRIRGIRRRGFFAVWGKAGGLIIASCIALLWPALAFRESHRGSPMCLAVGAGVALAILALEYLAGLVKLSRS